MPWHMIVLPLLRTVAEVGKNYSLQGETYNQENNLSAVNEKTYCLGQDNEESIQILQGALI